MEETVAKTDREEELAPEEAIKRRHSACTILRPSVMLAESCLTALALAK